jgi:CheY-like chemotaxis protein
MVALVFIVAFIVLKLAKKPTVYTQTHPEAQQSKKEVEKPTEQRVEKKELPPQKEHVAPVLAVEEKEIKKTINRKKRELVSHDKIVKEDFEHFKGIKILIAEDNIINQKVILGMLGASGIEIQIANNGQEALDMLENDKDFALVLMDAHMPVMDGFEATRMIRKNPNFEHIPVIALSGDTAADDIKNMLNVGMEAHLEKPLKMDALYDVFYMYTSEKDKKTKDDDSEKYVEFDVKKGLEICGGDKLFYHEILDDFISKYSDSADLLHTYINNSDALSANRMLLDIIGVAANIGAEDLHDMATALKQSITNPNDLEYITNLKKYKRSLQRVCSAIAEYQR